METAVVITENQFLKLLPGYRLDAAKHMWPADISAILGKTKNSKHGGKPFVYQEVIDLYGSEPIKASDYDHIGAVTEFKFGEQFCVTLTIAFGE